MQNVTEPQRAFIRRFLARISPDIARSFSAAQLTAVQQAFGLRYSVQHHIDIRRRLRLPFGNFYLVILAGRDYRAD
jgi:hypothetical protein